MASIVRASPSHPFAPDPSKSNLREARVTIFAVCTIEYETVAWTLTSPLRCVTPSGIGPRVITIHTPSIHPHSSFAFDTCPVKQNMAEREMKQCLASRSETGGWGRMKVINYWHFLVLFFVVITYLCSF